MSLFLFILFVPFVVALLPLFIHKDSDKSRSLVVTSWAILAALLVIGAIPLFPSVLLSSLAIPLVLIPGTFFFSSFGFVLEIIDKKKRGHSMRSALWSTSFLAFLFTGVIIVYLLVSLLSTPV